MDKYDEIEKMARWVNDNRVAVAEEGMTVLIFLADKKKIRSMCMSGNALALDVFLNILYDAISNADVGVIN